MFDVNPLGPMMHLKEIERETLALKAAKANIRPGIHRTVERWVVRVLRRLGVSLKSMSTGHGAHVGRR